MSLTSQNASRVKLDSWLTQYASYWHPYDPNGWVQTGHAQDSESQKQPCGNIDNALESDDRLGNQEYKCNHKPDKDSSYSTDKYDEESLREYYLQDTLWLGAQGSHDTEFTLLTCDREHHVA